MPHITTDDGVQLNYLVEDYREPWLGEPSTTVLLHHGFLRNLEFWTPFVPSIARHYRVVRYDVRGAGKSSAPPATSPWTLDRLVRDALNLVDALEIERVHWAGFESAGIVGISFAANHPDRTASVACFNTPYRDPASEKRVREIFRCGYSDFVEAIDVLGFENWIRKLCDQGILVDLNDPPIVEWVANQAMKIPATVAIEWHKIFESTGNVLADLVGRVMAPVLLVAGGKVKDFVPLFGCEDRLLEGLKNKIQQPRGIVYIPGVGTSVQLLAPDACAAAYLAFLKEMDSANAPKS